MKLLISDIETNGFLDVLTKFHCAVTIDYFTGERKYYRPWDFKQYVKDLEDCAAEGGLICFHNGIKYDHPALKILKKLYFGKNLNLPKKNVLDTLVISRLLYSNLKDIDSGLLRSGKITGKMFGSHSLKAWGMRLGEYKGEYGEQDGAWIEYNEPMMTYCEQDVYVTLKLFDKFISDGWYFPNGAEGLSESVLLEHEAAWLLAKQERNGYPFDVNSAEKLYCETAARRSEILRELTKTFGSWFEVKGGTQPFLHPRTGKPLSKYPRVKYPKAGAIFTAAKKKTLSKTLYIKDAPFTPVRHITFNPSSRTHITKVLKDCGWIPTDFTDAGNPIVDDDALSLVIEHKLIPDEFIPKVELIKEYLMIQKLLGQLAEGGNAWLRLQKEGYIHGYVNPNGAVTGRATHSYPNLAQVPSIRKYRGVECRSLFGAEHHKDSSTGKPWIQVGVDASGLELRCLGHFMAKFDNGEYIDIILNGDIHTQNQTNAGLPTRDNAKTFIYGFLYGAGAQKLGEIVGKFGEEGKKAGGELMKKFLENTPAIASLREQVANTLIKEAKWTPAGQVIKWKRKWIRGLDGRKVHVRSPHAALNTLLQSAGGLICKKWIVEWDKGMKAAGYKHGWDGDYCFMVWVHDEAQLACRTDAIADDCIRIAQEAMRAVGEHWNFRCPLDTEGKKGGNWAICH